MSTTFTRCPTVAVGQAVTSTEYATASRAFADRHRSGLGDPSYRVHQYLANFWRQVRFPDETIFPSEREFLTTYIHLDPSTSNADWPGVEPDEPGGANSANPAMAWIFGRGNVAPESDRLNGVPLFVGDNTDPVQLWDLAKRQRGYFHEDHVAESYTPMMSAAQAHFYLVHPRGTFHHKSYGGYLPGPEYVGMCSDPDRPSYPQYTIRFTKIIDGSVLEYLTACYDETASDKVVYVGNNPLAYVVYFADGSVSNLLKSEYIEGPYRGAGRLTHPDGDQFSRMMLSPFLREFAGTLADKEAETKNVDRIAFLNEEFWRSQYYLAPSRASWYGSALSADYPVWTFTGATTISAGTTATAHQFDSGHTLAGWLVTASKLTQAVTLEALDGSTVLAEIVVSPSGENGEFSKVTMFPAWSSPNLNFRLKADAVFTDSTGKVEVEAAELMRYRPLLHDAYALLRLASAKKTFPRTDSIGFDEDFSRWIFDRYWTSGACVNYYEALGVETQTENANENPVFDAARRFTRAVTRVYDRQSLRGYAVENGKSVLWFARYVTVSGEQLDQWDGIVDAIEDDPGPHEWSNEWTMFTQTAVYKGLDNPLDGSGWDTGDFADWVVFNSRAHFYSFEINTLRNTDMLRHFAQGPPYPSILVNPEAASAYTYAGTAPANTNIPSWEIAESFYKSCQIYPPDYEIESAESVTVAGEEQVKVTFKTRFQHCSVAELAASSDPWTWDRDALVAEPYRTDENAIREYLVRIARGLDASFKVGDCAANTSQGDIGGDPYGSVIPTFHFTKLVPFPYEDGNDTVQKTDCVIYSDWWHHCELFLRSWCEGYVDGATTESLCSVDEASHLFDFTFENLCYQANGQRWFTAPSLEDRPDVPQTFGPLCGHLIRAEHFNQIARAVNLLDSVRIAIPQQVWARQRGYYDEDTPTPTWSNGSQAVLSGYSPPQASTVAPATTTDWYEAGTGGFSARVDAAFTGDYSGSDPLFGVSNIVIDYKVELVDPLALNALGANALDLYLNTPKVFLGNLQTTTRTPSASTVATSGEAYDCDGTPLGNGGTWYQLAEDVQITNECRLFSSGVLEAGSQVAGDFALCAAGSVPTASSRSLGVSPANDNTVAIVVPVV